MTIIEIFILLNILCLGWNYNMYIYSFMLIPLSILSSISIKEKRYNVVLPILHFVITQGILLFIQIKNFIKPIEPMYQLTKKQQEVFATHGIIVYCVTTIATFIPLLAFLLDLNKTYARIDKMNEDLKYTATHDHLTGLINRHNIQEYFEDYLRLIGRLVDNELPMCRDAVRSLISSMVSIAAGQWIENVNRMRDINVILLNPRSEHKTLVFRQFMKLVSENYTRHRQVFFYADQLCMSPKYLSKLVKEVSGKSAPEWIDAYVMLEAKHLLKYSDMPVKEIVFKLHFSNQTVFYKYFKAHSGMTPTQYRNS